MKAVTVAAGPAVGLAADLQQVLQSTAS